MWRAAVPEGVLPPVIVVISDTALRVSWLAPTKPNGPITAYLLHLDDVITHQRGPITAYLLHLDDVITRHHRGPITVYLLHLDDVITRHHHGPITAYLLHLDDVIIDPQTAWPSSYVIDGLEPYTVYDIQVGFTAGGVQTIGVTLLLHFALAREVMQSPPSVCPPVRLFVSTLSSETTDR